MFAVGEAIETDDDAPAVAAPADMLADAAIDAPGALASADAEPPERDAEAVSEAPGAEVFAPEAA